MINDNSHDDSSRNTFDWGMNIVPMSSDIYPLATPSEAEELLKQVGTHIELLALSPHNSIQRTR